ncbi:aminoglycoside 6-adenylyltransferase [Nocardia sp. CDC159]|uniref:Aminoglycoside 6-adenylyltransferase n=1 Tax=Nocardia pulmonis TaxID=2951408 RepID=A0A9X2IVL4_9NOCA|nr:MULTISPECIES: aminoglycoside 6-adenylyltransferase [Nocardia]MCM6774022.1 aminoglycoside 6-adenylyltransferase [Nocardia pulmonis]MCM6786909.1 aminoglycoside 6-adenylyltransferase [Nocardia sp. CDC159]
MTDTAEVFVARVIEWARSQSDIRAVLRTGSRARGDGSVDALSDHDIELYTTTPERYLGFDEWLSELGEVAVNIELDGPYDNPAHLVFFADGSKADFQVLPVDLLGQLTADGLDELHERGYQVLYERDGVTAGLPAATGGAPEAELPDETEFREHCAEFWFEIAHVPRYLARGELWVVRARDWETKELLLTAIEWHALAHYGAGHDVWHNGTKMREWAAPGVFARVEAMFAIEDPLRQARAAADLFAELSRAIAEACGFRYPEDLERAIRPVLDELPSR